MINRQQLLADLKPLLKHLESDLRARCDEVPQIDTDLKTEYDQARAADRTGFTFEQWRSDLITQVAVAWVLSCVFVRFLEDNALIDPPRIAGPIGSQQSAISSQQNPLADSRSLIADRLSRARDERETYFKTHARQTDREYLLSVFDDLAKLPGTKDIFGPHNLALSPAYRNWLSGDAAQKLIEFFQKIDTDGTGEIIHDFTSDQLSAVSGQRGSKADSRSLNAESSSDDTRFLGDLYQDLSEDARKKYALLQTPIFVEEFILERTLEPAIKEFGLDGRSGQGKSGQRSAVSGQPSAHADSRSLKADSFKMIDPACGSGHFLLGAFARILKHWRAKEPATNIRELVNRALASIHGVDLNPYAIAIARFRLLLAAMRECHITKLADAPAFTFNLACGDSLLHGSPGNEQHLLGFDELAHAYQSEDLPELQRILLPGAYHAVVANPPYITVKDKALNQAYRERYPEVCHRQYSLSVPFLQRLFILACDGGFTGQITANSFMKREFGSKLVESYLPKIDLTHVLDTSGAYIPGHGTPTVILFGRNRPPVAPTIRAVMGIKGEPSTPDDPAQGQVWTAILNQIDHVGSQSAFVSVNDTPREQFSKHPWSIGGGGAAELKGQLDECAKKTLGDIMEVVGFGAVTREDEAYLVSSPVASRNRIPQAQVRPLVEGETVRNWSIDGAVAALWPYDPATLSVHGPEPLLRFLWPSRVYLSDRVAYGMTQIERGLQWWEYSMFFRERFRTPLSIVFGEVATHNHFVLDRGGKVFNRTAPVIKLPTTATEDDHLALLGLLNCSVTCFWLKQGAHNKGDSTDDQGSRTTGDVAFNTYQFNATLVGKLPLPDDRPLALTRQLDTLAQRLSSLSPSAWVGKTVPTAALLAECAQQFVATLAQMIALQEELDWQCYKLYGLLSDQQSAVSGQRTESLGLKADELKADRLPPLALGQRAFEIVLARRIAAGEEESSWFTRHGSTPITEIPKAWPAEYRKIVQKRIDLIESDKNIALIERPEYKRRWNTEPWQEQQERALRSWLLDRLESYFDFDGRMKESGQLSAVSGQGGSGQLSAVSSQPEKRAESRSLIAESSLTSVAKVADLARADKDFMQVAELYCGRMDFNVAALVGELITDESVPALAVLRYKPAALDKRQAWERTWELQRQEDAIDALFDVAKLSAISGQRSAGGGQPSGIDALVAGLRGLVPAERCKLIADCLTLAAGHIAEATKQKLDLTSDIVLKPVHDAAKRAKKAAVGDIPVPPKYTSADFLSGNVWRLRGKLDVPKERWVSFPHCEGEDGTLVIAWAGYDHLQLARAIAERYELAKEQEGRKLVPLLAAIGELLPWLKQWHNEIDPTFGTRMGDYFEGYLAEEAKAIEQSVEQVKGWKPAEKVGRTRNTVK